MGLSINVGSLAYLLKDDPEGAEWDRADLAAASAALAEAGLPAHVEPESLPKLKWRARISGFPYSYLHHLRRAYAHATERPDEPLPTFPAKADPTADPLYDDVLSSFASHLLCHSDCEGYYVPVDFPEPLFPDEKIEVGGGMLGSSQGLMRELVEVAPALGVKLGKGGKLSDAESKRLNEVVDAGEGSREVALCAWLALFEAARLSVAHGTAIRFG